MFKNLIVTHTRWHNLIRRNFPRWQLWTGWTASLFDFLPMHEPTDQPSSPATACRPALLACLPMEILPRSFIDSSVCCVPFEGLLSPLGHSQLCLFVSEFEHPSTSTTWKGLAPLLRSNYDETWIWLPTELGLNVKSTGHWSNSITRIKTWKEYTDRSVLLFLYRSCFFWGDKFWGQKEKWKTVIENKILNRFAYKI